MPRILQRHESRSLALIRPPASPEWTPLVLAPLPASKAALMPFIVDDDFYDFAREHRLPDCAVSFLMRAGSWSARASRSGFVPATMLADFGSDPDQAKRTLCAAGLLERADGGWQIIEGRVTVINAVDAGAKAAERQAAKSAGGKRGNHERWHEKRAIRVPGCEFCEASAPQKTAKAKRTSHSDRMRSVSDSDATPIDRSDLDLYLDQSVGSSQSDAGAREPSPLALVVIAEVRKRENFDIDTETAEQAAVIILARRKKGPPDDPAAYVASAVARERDLYAELLCGLAPPLADVLAEFAEAPPGDRHEYDHNPATGACRECDMPRSNKSRHLEAA